MHTISYTNLQAFLNITPRLFKPYKIKINNLINFSPNITYNTKT